MKIISKGRWTKKFIIGLHKQEVSVKKCRISQFVLNVYYLQCHKSYTISVQVPFRLKILTSTTISKKHSTHIVKNLPNLYSYNQFQTTNFGDCWCFETLRSCGSSLSKKICHTSKFRVWPIQPNQPIQQPKKLSNHKLWKKLW